MTTLSDAKIQDLLSRFPNLTKERINELKETFALFDTDGSGTIDEPELQGALNRVCNQYFDHDAVQKMIKTIDINGKLCVTYNDRLCYSFSSTLTFGIQVMEELILKNLSSWWDDQSSLKRKNWKRHSMCSMLWVQAKIHFKNHTNWSISSISQNHDGNISAEEIARVLTGLGETITAAEVSCKSCFPRLFNSHVEFRSSLSWMMLTPTRMDTSASMSSLQWWHMALLLRHAHNYRRRWMDMHERVDVRQ